MKEGIPICRVMSPLLAPMNAAIARPMKKAGIGCSPPLTMSAINMGDKAYTEPTERSNSPEIMRNEMPTAMIPNWAAIVSMLPRF